MVIVQFLKMSIPTPRRVTKNSKGRGELAKIIIFKGKYEAKLEFLEGWVGNC